MCFLLSYSFPWGWGEMKAERRTKEEEPQHSLSNANVSNCSPFLISHSFLLIFLPHFPAAEARGRRGWKGQRGSKAIRLVTRLVQESEQNIRVAVFFPASLLPWIIQHSDGETWGNEELKKEREGQSHSTYASPDPEKYEKVRCLCSVFPFMFQLTARPWK